MKLRNIILMTASVAMTACSKQAVPTAIPEDARIEQQVEELLSKMDLDAKIGQMTELAIDVLGETIMVNSNWTRQNSTKRLLNTR